MQRVQLSLVLPQYFSNRKCSKRLVSSSTHENSKGIGRVTHDVTSATTSPSSKHSSFNNLRCMPARGPQQLGSTLDLSWDDDSYKGKSCPTAQVHRRPGTLISSNEIPRSFPLRSKSTWYLRLVCWPYYTITKGDGRSAGPYRLMLVPHLAHRYGTCTQGIGPSTTKENQAFFSGRHVCRTALAHVSWHFPHHLLNRGSSRCLHSRRIGRQPLRQLDACTLHAADADAFRLVVACPLGPAI